MKIRHNIFKCLTILFLLDCPKRYKGVDLHTFLFFLPTPDLCQLVSVSLTEEGKTQDKPKSEKMRFQTALVLSQWMRMWSTDSSSLQQRKPLFAITHSLLWMWSKVNTWVYPQHFYPFWIEKYLTKTRQRALGSNLPLFWEWM